MNLDGKIIDFIERGVSPDQIENKILSDELGKTIQLFRSSNNELQQLKSTVRRFFNAKSIKEFLETQKELIELIRRD